MAAPSPTRPLGVPTTRLDGPDKVTGRAKYAGDTLTPGLLYAVLVQSTIARGTILSIDTAAARRSPGTVEIFTRTNLPALAPPPADFTASFPAERRPPLADDTVHYAGQHLALVVAATLEQAQRAASLVRVHYRAETPTLALTPNLPGSYAPDHFATNSEEKLNTSRGTPGPSPAATIAAAYTTPVVTHNPMEPSATVAQWGTDLRTGQPRLTVHDSTRWLQGEQRVLAAMLSLQPEQIEIVSPFVGGAFGSKGFLWQHVALNAQASRALGGRPVKLVLTRQQMFTSTGHRPRTIQQLRFSATADGQLTSLTHDTLTETSPVAHFIEPAGATTKLLYRSPHVAVSHQVVPTNLATPCFMRAPGESPGMFALESAIDELAHQLRLDPLVLRQRNDTLIDQSANDGAGRPFSSRHLLECYQLGADRFGWSRRSPEPRSMREGNQLIGYGMATAAYPARRSPCTVHATLSPAGIATFSAASQAIGTGTTTAMSQIAAAALGLPLRQVRFLLGNSSFTEAPVAGASQTAASVGSATHEAALQLRTGILQLAAADPNSPFHGADPATLRLEDGILRSATASEPLSALLARNPDASLSITASSRLDDDAKKAYTFHSFGAHFCELAVDADFGEVRVRRWTTVLDCGLIINPMGARSQALGGIIFGIGMALLEGTVYDQHTGIPLNSNLAEYLLPTCADVPSIDVHFVEHPDTRFDPLGNRGVGEIPICGVPGAIANAIFHATGHRLRDLPFTPDKLLRSA